MLSPKKITARRVIGTSFVVDAIDLVLSLFVAILSGSVVMLTQVLEAFADLTASGFLLIGLKRSEKKEDRSHPFGYGREIYFWTLLSALVMFTLTSSLSIYFGWQRFIKPEPIESLGLALLVLAITFLTNSYAFILSLKRLLRNRPVRLIAGIFYRSSLAETKTTFILDLMGASASIIGFVALSFYFVTGDARMDGLGAILIGIALAILSVFLILGIRDLLIGRSASEETEEKITKAALSIQEVNSVLNIKTLHIGPDRLLVNLDVHLHSDLSTREVEHVVDLIEDKIKLEVPSVKYIQVELEAI